jgi:hypothetical protein
MPFDYALKGRSKERRLSFALLRSFPPPSSHFQPLPIGHTHPPGRPSATPSQIQPSRLVTRWYSVIPIKVAVPHRPNQSSKQLLIVPLLPHCLRTPQLWNSNIQADIVARLNRNTGHTSISPHKATFLVHSTSARLSSRLGDQDYRTLGRTYESTEHHYTQSQMGSRFLML